MEIQAEYKAREVKLNEDSLTWIYCGVCDFYLGNYKEIDGEVWLSVGNLDLKVAHGKCGRCDTEWHFVSSDKKLERLVKRIVDNRKLTTS